MAKIWSVNTVARSLHSDDTQRIWPYLSALLKCDTKIATNLLPISPMYHTLQLPLPQNTTISTPSFSMDIVIATLAEDVVCSEASALSLSAICQSVEIAVALVFSTLLSPTLKMISQK